MNRSSIKLELCRNNCFDESKIKSNEYDFRYLKNIYEKIDFFFYYNVGFFFLCFIKILFLSNFKNHIICFDQKMFMNELECILKKFIINLNLIISDKQIFSFKLVYFLDLNLKIFFYNIATENFSTTKYFTKNGKMGCSKSLDIIKFFREKNNPTTFKCCTVKCNYLLNYFRRLQLIFNKNNEFKIYKKIFRKNKFFSLFDVERFLVFILGEKNIYMIYLFLRINIATNYLIIERCSLLINYLFLRLIINLLNYFCVKFVTHSNNKLNLLLKDNRQFLKFSFNFYKETIDQNLIFMLLINNLKTKVLFFKFYIIDFKYFF
ncbi:hypothetical protein (nucleomorph) [Guillardia theta]|uniref:Uncharacterized protein n=1 Tax=Guillardia theta TaxID=55529 RepID=Q98S07_GUITH|nr:hypothetical protein GTHECHR3127 [Guillardia theta]AAK39771.1 hypothetical protein [Guillardia theta]|mmetsp:Transcript_36819/g.115208  ORF Transcript_36819/g.115208 Transcript_36819/m.115208 type:complete len:320 (-) Transcript_36819:1447-2406(-)